MRLKAFCENKDFKGWDPYDGLNSNFFQSLVPIRKNRYAKLSWIQFFKHSPVNLRLLFGVEKGYNPKAIALFLSGYCNLFHIDRGKEYLERIDYLLQRLLSLKSQGYSGSCWGYNFDWQARAFCLPAYTPTVVVSSFAAGALLDAFDVLKDNRLLDLARSVCDFILKDLNRRYNESGNFAFSYSPQDKSVVFNASFLGAKTLARIYSYTKEDRLIKEAKKPVAFCCRYQKVNGSFAYGILPYHQWIDSLHTGYNIQSLWEYERFSGDTAYHLNIEKGLEYYIKSFFTKEGVPKYYDDKTYPIDAHSTAQLIVTLCKMAKKCFYEELIEKVLYWTIENMQDEQGFFYYQFGKMLKCKIPYMRWSQAWMFYALSYLIKRSGIRE